jgi:putative flippase GtrA
MNTEGEVELLAEWQEPHIEASGWAVGPARRYVMLGLVAIIILLLVVGIWLKNSTLYIGAIVVAAAIAAITTQSRNDNVSLKVEVTNRGIVAGKRIYLVDELAGFWLGSTAGYVTINLELKRRTPLPATFIYNSNDVEEARNLFLEILPELEPRKETISDTLTKYIRL